MPIVGNAIRPLSLFKAWIVLTHDSVTGRGVTVSCSPAPKKTTSGDTQTTFQLDEPGTYTVTSTDGTFTESTTVTITDKKQTETVTLTLFDIALSLVINGTTYSIGRSDTSKGSSSGNYQYSRSGKNWYLYIRADATLSFSTLQTNVDICGVGGGGGGGGGSCGGSGYSAFGSYGGCGGGGAYKDTYNESMSLNTTYTATIGAGGSGGTGGPGAGKRGDDGNAGSATTFKKGSTTIISASGGPLGHYGDGYINGQDGNGTSETNVFYGHSQFSTKVSGSHYEPETTASNYGAGGGGGWWHYSGENPYTTNGKAGKKGLICIRNAR